MTDLQYLTEYYGKKCGFYVCTGTCPDEPNHIWMYTTDDPELSEYNTYTLEERDYNISKQDGFISTSVGYDDVAVALVFNSEGILLETHHHSHVAFAKERYTQIQNYWWNCTGYKYT